MQQVILIGNLGRDAVAENNEYGYKIKLALAVNTYTKNEQVTHWYSVTLWGERWQSKLNDLKKGKQVFVQGSFMPATYTDKNGNAALDLRVNASVIYTLGSKSESEPARKASALPNLPNQDEEDDDLPF